MPDDKKIKGGLWNKKSKAGLDYWSGSFTVQNRKFYVTVFKNTKKEEGSNQPDYNFFVGEANKPAQQGQQAVEVAIENIPF